MKRKLTLLLALLTLSAAPPAFAYDFEADGIYYNISSSSEVAVTSKDDSYNCYNGEVVVPETVTNNGTTYTVTSVEKGIFANSTDLSLTLPGTVKLVRNQFESVTGLISFTSDVTAIPGYCFKNCSNLVSVDLPKATALGDYYGRCFYYCTNLKSVNVPNVTKISEHCFINCDSLKSIELPKVTELEEGCFWRCKGLESVKAPKATTIGNFCFRYCDKLASVEIPNVETLGKQCFESCKSLTSIEIPKVTVLEDVNLLPGA